MHGEADYLRWRAAALAKVRIAVDASPLRLRNRDFIGEVKQAIDIDARAATRLDLEIIDRTNTALRTYRNAARSIAMRNSVAGGWSNVWPVLIQVWLVRRPNVRPVRKGHMTRMHQDKAL